MAFIFCFGLGILLKELNLYRLPYGLDIALFALLFIQIGHWLKRKQFIEKQISNRSLWVKIGLTIIAFCLTFFVSQINDGQEPMAMVHRVFNNYFLYLVGALFGCLFILYLSNCLPSMRIFDFFGRNTIFLLGFHLVILGLIKGIQVFLLHIPLEITKDFLIVDIVYVLFTFVLLSPLIYLVNKYMPFLLGRQKGII
jgi:hypothetical protein